MRPCCGLQVILRVPVGVVYYYLGGSYEVDSNSSCFCGYEEDIDGGLGGKAIDGLVTLS